IVAQTVLALPLVVAFTAAAVQAVEPGLLDQAPALGASRFAVGRLALREARVGVIAPAIAAGRPTLAQGRAGVLVRRNIHGHTDTLASAMLIYVGQGRYDVSIALGTILLGIIFILAAILTVAQHSRSLEMPRRRRVEGV